MYRRSIMILICCIGLTTSTVVVGQSTSTVVVGQSTNFKPSPYIYKIRAAQCPQAPNERVLTGFRVRNLKGIVTALHGVLGCKTITAQPGGNGPTFDNLIIGKVDIKRDVALLWSESLNQTQAQGLEILLSPKANDYIGLQVIGYPFGLFRQKPTVDVKVTELTELGNLLPEEAMPAIGKRASPALDIKVFSVQAHLVPGHSGAPLMTQAGRVMGVGNGGIDLGRVEMAWVIPWSAIEWKTVSTRVSQEVSWLDAQRLTDLEKNDPQLIFSFAVPETPTPTSTATKVLSQPVVTPSPTSPPQETPTPVLPSCQVGDPFFSVWQQFSRQLGCNTSSASTDTITHQPFQGGFLVWIKSEDRIYALQYAAQQWETYPNTWTPGDESLPCEAARSYGYPAMGFGKLWCSNSTLNSVLGAPLGKEVPDDYAMRQIFELGQIFRVQGGKTFILFNNGRTWISP